MKYLRLPGLKPEHRTFLKWSLMLVSVFWALVYKLSQTQVGLPEFVYVNF